MSDLATRTCTPCTGAMPVMDASAAAKAVAALPGWTLAADGRAMTRRWEFKGFARAVQMANLAASRLALSIGPAATVLQVTAGHGVKFPDLEEGDWFPLALVNDFAQTEYLRCTARSNDTLTVQRAQEGSIARAYSAGDAVELRLTLAALEELRDFGNLP